MSSTRTSSLSSMPFALMGTCVLLFVASMVVGAEGYYLCTCQCCTQGSCYRVPQMGVVVSDCGACSTADCVHRIDSLINISAVAQGATRGYKACIMIRAGEAAACKPSSPTNHNTIDAGRCGTRLATVGSTCQARSFSLQYWSSYIWGVIVAVLLIGWLLSWVRPKPLTQ